MTLNDIKITPIMDSLRLEKISDEVYFSEPYRNYVSNSRLGLMFDWESNTPTPDKFFEGFKPFYSPSLAIGTAVHSLTLQKEYFNIVEDIDLPTGKMGIMAEELFKIWKGHIPDSKSIKEVAKKIDYYGGNLTDKRVEEVKEKCKNFWIKKKQRIRANTDTSKVDLYLDPRSRETSLACINALQNNVQIQKLLNPKSEFDEFIVANEKAILLDVLVEIPETKPFKLRLKAKLDNFTIDTLNNEICVNDIKTLGRTVDQMKINIDKYHYNREFAFYSYLLVLVTKKFYNIDNATVRGNYLVVSTIPEYYTKVVKMTKKMYYEGLEEFKMLLKLVSYFTATKYKNFGIWE